MSSVVRLILILIAILVIVILIGYEASGTIYSATSISQNASNPIQHVVIIMQENRSFDNYFGTYPGADGFSPNFCMPVNPNDTSLGCVKPFLSTNPVTSPDMPHTLVSSRMAYDGGKMDGFFAAVKTFSKRGNATNSMEYYDNRTLPNLWNYAAHFVLADHFFSSVLSYSQPNHWYMVAGQSPAVSLNESASQEEKQCVTKGSVDLSSCTYIDQAQTIQTILDMMTNSGVTWKYYDSPVTGTLARAVLNGGAFDYWNVLKAKNSTYSPAYNANFVSRGEIFSDIQDKTLPQVSWVIPSSPISDHPPANITLGEYWVTDVVNAVMESQYWQNTVIIILWDDYGGFFDTVAPPSIDTYGLGFRCPALIVSAYARAGYIDHTFYSFESTLKFIEWRFGLHSLNSRDASANNLLNAFDFTQSPLKPDVLPLSSTELATISPFIQAGGSPTPIPGGGNASSSTSLMLQFINDDPD